MRFFIYFAMVGFTFQPSARASETHNVIECTIIGMDKKIIKKFPGHLCVFLPDGRVFYGAGDKFGLLSPNGRKVWDKPISVHHQLNLNAAKDRILVLSSDSHRAGKDMKMVRFDQALLFSLGGKLISQFSVYEHRKELEKWIPRERRGVVYESGVQYNRLKKEYSHANSFYEIPDNPAAKKNPAFKQGNYIINISSIGLFIIVDAKLENILWHGTYEKFRTGLAHDVQILPNGHLLFYSNSDAGPKNVFSSLNEVDPITEKTIWRWQPNPRKLFSAPASGGVQLLENGNILYNDPMPSGSGVEINRDGNNVWVYKNTFAQSGRPIPFQQIKRMDLTEFLKNNHAP